MQRFAYASPLTTNLVERAATYVYDCEYGFLRQLTGQFTELACDVLRGQRTEITCPVNSLTVENVFGTEKVFGAGVQVKETQPRVNYRVMQRELKALREKGTKLNCKLNAKYEVVRAEYARLFNI